MLMYVLAPKGSAIKPEKAIVFGGRGPIGGTDQHRGYQLTLQTTEPVQNTKYITLLVPQTKTAPKPKEVKLVKLESALMSLS